MTVSGSATASERGKARASGQLLSAAIRTSLAGVVLSVMLLGFVSETQPLFYAVLGLSLLVYLMARGEAILKTAVQYLSSSTMVWRWVFLAWAVASLLWASRANSLGRVTTLLEIHAVGLVLYDSARHLKATRWVLTLVFVGAAVGATHAMLTGLNSGAARLEGLYSNPNVLAVTLVMGLAAFNAGAGLGRNRLARMVAHGLAIVILAGIVSTASVKGIVGVLCIWVVGLLVWHTRRRIAIQLASVAAMAVLLVPLGTTFQTYWERALQRVSAAAFAVSSQAGVSYSLVERERFVRKGLSLIAESPWAGSGLGSFSWLSGEGTYAHSNPIELGVALGVAGVALYYLLHAIVLYRGVSLRRHRVLAARFAMLFVPTLLVLDLAVVSYAMKLPTLLLIMSAGWIDARLGGDSP